MEHSSSHGAPMSSKRATRSRGSNWPRRSNSGLASADLSRARVSSARSCAISESMWSRLRVKASPFISILDSIAGKSYSSTFGFVARWNPSNACVVPRGGSV